MITDPWFYVAAAVAVSIGGIAKGGFAGAGTVSVPILSLATTPVHAAAIMLPILVVQDAVSVWAFRRSWSPRLMAIMLPGACVGIGIGYLLASRVSEARVGLVVGLIALSFAVWRLWLEKVVRRAPPAPGSVAGGLFWGAVSGFTSMVSHAGAAPFQVHVLPQKLDRETFVATSTWFFAAVNWLKVGPYFVLGQLSRDNLLTSAALFPLAVVATIGGVWLVRRVPGERFFVIIYALLIVVGTKLVWDGVAA